MTWTEIHCATCGKPKIIRADREHKKNYCNNECRGKGITITAKVNCVGCDAEITTTRRRMLSLNACDDLCLQRYKDDPMSVVSRRAKLKASRKGVKVYIKRLKGKLFCTADINRAGEVIRIQYPEGAALASQRGRYSNEK